jgi:siroheme synthase
LVLLMAMGRIAATPLTLIRQGRDPQTLWLVVQNGMTGRPCSVRAPLSVIAAAVVWVRLGAIPAIWGNCRR